MPILEYRCLKCGNSYEIFHKVREVKKDIICPSCSSVKYKKLMSVPSIATSSSSGDSCGDGRCDDGGGCCGGGMCGMD